RLATHRTIRRSCTCSRTRTFICTPCWQGFPSADRRAAKEAGWRGPSGSSWACRRRSAGCWKPEPPIGDCTLAEFKSIVGPSWEFRAAHPKPRAPTRGDLIQVALEISLNKSQDMPVNLTAPQPGELHPVPGVRIGVAEAGIRKANRRDLTVVL